MTLPVLVAPDSFKGTFSAREVAAAVASGLGSAGREARELPVADGGEGTMEVLVDALGGEVRAVTVFGNDPDSEAPAGPWDRACGFVTVGEGAKARPHLQLAAEKHHLGHYMDDVARVHWERLKK